MVFLRYFMLVIALLLLGAPSFAGSTIETREGSYIDLRGQIRSPYDPPHAENIPTQPRLQQTITNTEMYYRINMEGYRGREYKLPPVPAEYTQHYSLRTPHPYTKQQYLDVWVEGEKVGKIYLTDEHAMSYFFLENWATGIIMAKIRARKFHRKPAVFLFVEDLVDSGSDMYNAKKFAKLLGVEIFYGTIDKRIPADWVQ